MSDEEWDAENFEPRDVKPVPRDQWDGEDEEAEEDSTADGDKHGDINKPVVGRQKNKKKLLKERIAEKDEKDKQLHQQQQPKKPEEVEGPRTKKQLQEERRKRMKQKEAANLESTLEACGLDRNSLEADVNLTCMPKDNPRN